MKAALLPLAIAGLAFSTLVPADAADARKIKAKYYCNKGQSLRVVFDGNRATVTPKGKETIVLRQAITADGFLYTKSKYSLRGRGDDATWTVGRQKPLHCHARG